MRLGAKGRYAVTALVDIAAQGAGRTVPLADIAARQGISVAFLEQIFARLRRAGLVVSIRGPGGGYRLARPPALVALSDVINAVEEPIKTTGCVEGSPLACTGVKGRCLTHHLWEDLGRHIETYFDRRTLADVAAPAHAASLKEPAA